MIISSKLYPNKDTHLEQKMSLQKTIVTINTTILAKCLLFFSVVFLAVVIFSITEIHIVTNVVAKTKTNTHTNSNNTNTKVINTTTTTYLKWFLPISKQFNLRKQPEFALINMNGILLEGLETLHANITQVHFERVSPNVTWRDIYPLWIDEGEVSMVPKCPNIPMPNVKKYKGGLDIVVANLPCRNWSQGDRVGLRDVYRLQVSLMAATLAAQAGNKEVYVVFVGECEPMLEMFRCDDLVWHEGKYWVYKPDVNRLKQKVLLPVGACEVASQPYYSQPAGNPLEELVSSTRSARLTKPANKEAYVTLLHSSELYVCGAIALAQSLLQTNTTKDLILLADDSISPQSIQGLQAAGWKTKRIQRVRCPSAKKGHYNEWNCSKLRIWQLIEYVKVIFIDADFIVLKNIDHFFNYPQLSASEDTMSIFNSGVMVVEPSLCFFDTLMAKRYTLNSYNGGDQGLLNEVFTWWHRITKKISFLKCFMDETGPREVPNDVYMIHFVGVKPWACYRDYDCNWDQIDRHIFASDQVHNRWWQVYDALDANLKSFCGLTPALDANIQKWRLSAKNNVNFTDTHWKIEVNDPRKFNLTDPL